MIRSTPLDSWYWLLQSGSVITSAVAVALLVVTLVVARRITQRDSHRLVSLELALSTQQRETADAKRALLELQERMKDRTLTDPQRAAFVAVLQRGPRCPVRLVMNRGDDEAERFASLIHALFMSAGWSAELGTIATPLASGIGLAPASGDRREPCPATLQQAFEAVGIKPGLWKGDTEGAVEILIGPKPTP